MQRSGSKKEINKSSGLRQIDFSTDEPQPYQENLKPLASVLTANGAFDVRAHGFDLRELLFMETQSMSPCFQTEHVPHGQCIECALIRLQLESFSKGVRNQKHVKIQTGDIALLDMNTPLVFQTELSRSLDLIISHDMLNMATEGGRLAYDRVIRGDSPEGKMLGHLLHTIWQQLPKAKVTDVKPISRILLSCIVSAFDVKQTTTEKQFRSGGQVSFEWVSAYIDKHLHEPLDTRHLCQELSVSRDKLYHLFKSHGGVAYYIRTARLKRCLEDLVHIKDTPVRIGDVSSHWGFSSQSHFSRLFHATFGMTPNEAVARGHSLRAVSFPRAVSDQSEFSGSPTTAHLS